MWDDFYGPVSPTEIVWGLRPLVASVQRATVPQDVPPELERELTELRRLYRKVAGYIAKHDEGS